MSNQYLGNYSLGTFLKIKDIQRQKILLQQVCKANLENQIAYVTLLDLCCK